MNSEPSKDWDAYCESREAAYRARVHRRSCLDCANCERPDEPYSNEIGWCLMSDAFVYPYDNPLDNECGCFE